MKTFIKCVVAGFVVILFAIGFNTTHNIQSIDDISYVIALGIDVGEEKNLKVTFQFSKPSSNSESGSSEEASSIIGSVEADSIDNAISLISTYVSKEINLSHCKLLIFSKELCEKGIEREIYSLANKSQIRPDSNIIVSNTTAKKYIENVHPDLENLISKYYSQLPDSSKYTGYTSNVELGQFVNRIASSTFQPVAILGNVVSENLNSTDSVEDSSFSKNKASNSDSSSTNQDSGHKIENAKNGIRNIGLAVFNHDRLIGTLSSSETLSYLIITGEVRSCIISVPDPQNEDSNLDLFFTFNKTPAIDVYIVNGSPYITLKVKAHARISSVEQIAGKITDQQIKEIGDSANSYLKEQISHYLYKTSKNLNADISNFGKHCLKRFKTLPEFEEYKWLEKYQDAFFKVECDIDVESGFLLIGN